MRREHYFGKTAEKHYNSLCKRGYIVKVYWTDQYNYECVDLYNRTYNHIGEFPTITDAYRAVSRNIY